MATNMITFEEGIYGARAILHGPWAHDYVRALRDANIVEIELNQGKGWTGDDVGFLQLFPDLLSVSVLDLRIKDVSGLTGLKKLRSLHLTTYCKTRVPFDTFQSLEECSVEWRAGAESVFACHTLKKLFLNKYPGAHLQDFRHLTNLNSLALLNAKVGDTADIDALHQLVSLRLAGLSRLSSLEHIGMLQNLERLHIDTCRSISSIDRLSNSKNLTELHLDNCGSIQSVDFVRALPRLRTFTFVESTSLTDGNLHPILDNRSVEKIAFQNRRHYSHTREELSVVIAARRLAR